MSKDKEAAENPTSDPEGGVSARVAGKKTSVDLTDAAMAVKERFQPIYGLRNILSAGLLLFELVSADMRVAAIRVANAETSRAEIGRIIEKERIERRQATAGKRYAVKQVLRTLREELPDPSHPATVEEKRAIGELGTLAGRDAVVETLEEIRQEEAMADIRQEGRVAAAV